MSSLSCFHQVILKENFYDEMDHPSGMRADSERLRYYRHRHEVLGLFRDVAQRPQRQLRHQRFFRHHS